MSGTITSKFGKVSAWFLILLIVLSFAAWGIGDVFRGRVENAVAKVGRLKITYDEYRAALSAETQRFQNMFQGQPVPDAVKREISEETLNSLIRQKLLLQETARLGLRALDKDVAGIVAQNPAFRDEKGNFDSRKFKDYLSRSGRSESFYLEELRSEIKFFLLMQSLTAERNIPEIELRNLYALSEQKRTAEIAYIPINYSKNAAASGIQLSAFYETHKQDFAMPESRSVTYALIDPLAAKNLAISDADLQREYERRIQEFSTPETRDIANIIVSDEKTAGEISAKLKNGADFQKLTAEKSSDKKVSVIKKATRDSLVPENLADAVFNLKNGEVSSAIKTPFGWHVIKVLAVYPPSQQGFAEVKDKLKSEMEKAHASEKVNKFIQDIDDEAASGAKPEEIAKKFGLELKKAMVQKQTVADPKNIETMREFIDNTFSTPQGAASAVFGLRGGKYAIVYVDHIQPARVRAFDEVRGAVADSYAKSQAEEAAEKSAADLAARTSGGKQDFAAAARSMNFNVTTLDSIKADYKSNDLPAEMLSDIFGLKEKDATKPYKLAGKYAVAQVKKIIPYSGKLDQAALTKLKSKREEEYVDDLTTQYFDYLRGKYPVHIEKDLLKKAE